jgi:hypothetical protein
VAVTGTAISGKAERQHRMPDTLKVRATLFGDGRVLPALGSLDLTPTQTEMVRAVGLTLRAYLNSAGTLINGKYSELRDRIPVHLKHSGRALAMICEDGLIIRYGDNGEGTDAPSGVAAGYSPQSITPEQCTDTLQLVPRVEARQMVADSVSSGAFLVLSLLPC